MSDTLSMSACRSAIGPVAVAPDARPAPGPAPAGPVLAGAGTLIGAVGLLAPVDRPPALSSAASRRAIVDVAIELRRDQASIVYCLAGLHAQTCRPRRIVFVDDGRGERDGTLVLAREFGAANGLRIEVLRLPPGHGGCTPAALAPLFDGDALLVLDGGTVLASPDYLARCVQALEEDARVASACGAGLPLRDEDRHEWTRSDAFRRWVGGDEYRDPCAPRGELQRVWRWLGDAYRESVGLVRQRGLGRGRVDSIGGLRSRPGAVLYRRALLERFGLPAAGSAGAGERLWPELVLAGSGYRAVRRPEVVARTRAPALGTLASRRARDARALLREARRSAELLRARAQPAVDALGSHGDARGHDARRPGVRMFAPTLAGRLAWPVGALVLLVVGGWPWLAGVAGLELAAWLLVLAMVAPGNPLAAVAAGLLVAPLRYVELIADAVGTAGFLLDPRR